MNPHETSDYKLSRNLLSIVGLWPYQNHSRKLFFLGVGVFGFSGLCIPQVLYCFRVDSTGQLFEALPLLVGSFICLSKGIGLLYYAEEVDKLIGVMKNDWKQLKNVSEVEILQRYAKNRGIFVYSYTIMVLGAVTFYILIPISGKLINTISSKNESNPHYIIYPANYFIDEQEYYYLILFHESICFYISTIVVLGADSLYVILVEHVCGMFTILSTRLESDSMEIDLALEEKEICDFIHIKRCVQLHIKLIGFIKQVEKTFTGISLFDISLGILLQAAAFMMAGFTNDPSERFRYTGVAVAQLFRLYYNSWPGQDLINHSIKVCESIYFSSWYEKSLKNQKLLLLFIRRSQIPCKLTIGQLYEYNNDSFLEVAKTSLSYCTILASVTNEEHEI